MLRSLVGSEMCIRDRYQRRVRDLHLPCTASVHVSRSYAGCERAIQALRAHRPRPGGQSSWSEHRPTWRQVRVCIAAAGASRAEDQTRALQVQRCAQVRTGQNVCTPTLGDGCSPDVPGSQVHPGQFGAKLGPEGAPYGRKNECRSEASMVHEMLNPDPQSRFQDAMEKDKCKLFHSSIREPMGKSYNHGLYVPQYAKEPDYRFGCFSDTNSWGTKELVCPPPNPEEGNPEHKRMYTLSHVAEQRKRNYQWDYDPTTFVFGKKGDRSVGGVENALKGDAAKEVRSATVIQKTVTDFKAFNQDHLGKVKHTGAGLHGMPAEHSFGVTTVKACLLYTSPSPRDS
eukprot:TRINITY_DN11697_c0_g1_i15.p1 TRINITY_DN11697_c0_g1~~TRINITY_DN11697_c0_g1_i15.p1  ORF type:complete len:342 (-),score=45.21 TRINITY_DN11697_c0_g1_i15:127-1152(-)